MFLKTFAVKKMLSKCFGKKKLLKKSYLLCYFIFYAITDIKDKKNFAKGTLIYKASFSKVLYIQLFETRMKESSLSQWIR